MSDHEPKPAPKTKLTLWIPEDVIEEAKVLAVRQKRPLSAVVTELLCRFIEASKRANGHAS